MGSVTHDKEAVGIKHPKEQRYHVSSTDVAFSFKIKHAVLYN